MASSSSSSSASEKSQPSPIPRHRSVSALIAVPPSSLRYPLMLALPPPPPPQVPAAAPHPSQHFRAGPSRFQSLLGECTASSPSQNLRPRNGLGVKTPMMAAGAIKSSGGEAKKKEKLGLKVSLTKREIEEDIFALTGRKPLRRPKRRTKLVQQQLDAVFPGLGLGSITPETYKVTENSHMG